jgi:hypothetical protein
MISSRKASSLASASRPFWIGAGERPFLVQNLRFEERIGQRRAVEGLNLATLRH